MIRLVHLETNVTSACQNSCNSCNHFVIVQRPLGKPFMLDPAAMARDLRNLSRICRVDKYGMLGGEPTLHPRLPELIEIAAESQIANEIEVWTNGQRLAEYLYRHGPDELSTPFWRAPFDALVVTAYPGKLTDAQIGDLEQACRYVGKRFELKDERNHPNFTQLLKKEPGRAQETFDFCWFKTFSRVIDNGYFYLCCCGPYIPKLLLGQPEGTDGLKIDEHTSEEDLLNFLNRREALSSCAVCAGRNTRDAVPVVWGETRDPAAWIEVSSGRAR